MDQVNIIFWSQTGNTQAMAESIARGVQEAGKEAKLLFVTEASVDDLKDAAGFALGCPAMGAEVLEEMDMEPFVEEVEKFVSGKTVALFGSYGWGDGEWMREWESRMSSAGAKVIGGENAIAHEAPDVSVLSTCESLGKQLAAL